MHDQHPGGGALQVGVADDSTLIGTEPDHERLRSHLYDRSQRRLTCDVIPAVVRGTRILVVIVPEALEPIRLNERITWRVADRCVDIDAATWHQCRLQGLQVDWSAATSCVTVDDVRETAIEIARDFLKDAGDDRSLDFAGAERLDLLRRLNAVDGSGHLTNAAALLFVGRGIPSIDYIRRSHAGAGSSDRVRLEDRSLLEELRDVFSTSRANNPVTHVAEGLTHAQLRQIPERALREAIVNGVAHRDWSRAESAVVDHIGGTLVVMRPGGFVTDVTSSNIINHPSSSRNTARVEILASLHVAEREGVGVDVDADRMFGDMLRLGCPDPTIEESTAPSVKTVLIGNNPALGRRQWLAATLPPLFSDLRLLMTVARLPRVGWVDEDSLAPYLQVTVPEARDNLQSLRDVTVDGTPLLCAVRGTPPDSTDAYALDGAAANARRRQDQQSGYSRAAHARGDRPVVRASARKDQLPRTRRSRRCEPQQRGLGARRTGGRRLPAFLPPEPPRSRLSLPRCKTRRRAARSIP